MDVVWAGRGRRPTEPGLQGPDRLQSSCPQQGWGPLPRLCGVGVGVGAVSAEASALQRQEKRKVWRTPHVLNELLW